MKKYFLIVLVILFHFISFAQQVELSIKLENISSFKNVVTANDGYYLIAEAPNKLWLIKTDFNGNISWQQDLWGYSIIDFKAKSNGDVIVISSDYECGYMYYGNEQVLMSIYSTTGNLVFEEYLFWDYFGADDYYVPYTKTTKSSIGEDWRLLFNGDSIYKVSDSGEIIFRIGAPDFHLNILYAFVDSQDSIVVSIEDRFNLPSGYIYIGDTLGNYFINSDINNFTLWGGDEKIIDINELPSGSYTLLSNMGGFYILEDINNVYNLFESISFYQLDSLTIYAFNSGWLTKTKEDGNIYEDIDLSDELDKASSFYKRNDTIFIVGNKNDKAAIVFLDTALNILNSIIIPNVNINDCLWNDSLILLAGEEIYLAALNNQNNLVNLPSALFKSFDNELNTSTTEQDAAITSCEIDTSYVTWYPEFDRVYTKINITLTNNGQTELMETRISLHYETRVIGDSCGYYGVYLYDLDSLNIMPGNDTLIAMAPITFTTYGNGSINLTTCAYVYSPNERLDADHNNNKCCTNHSISLGLDNIQQSTFNLYPNPATNQVFIQSSEKITFLNIYDIVGRQIDNRIWEKENSTIDVSGLEKGVYVFLINNSVSRKVVVE